VAAGSGQRGRPRRKWIWLVCDTGSGVLAAPGAGPSPGPSPGLSPGPSPGARALGARGWLGTRVPGTRVPGTRVPGTQGQARGCRARGCPNPGGADRFGARSTAGKDSTRALSDRGNVLVLRAPAAQGCKRYQRCSVRRGAGAVSDHANRKGVRNGSAFQEGDRGIHRCGECCPCGSCRGRANVAMPSDPCDANGVNAGREVVLMNQSANTRGAQSIGLMTRGRSRRTRSHRPACPPLLRRRRPARTPTSPQLSRCRSARRPSAATLEVGAVATRELFRRTTW
jgi:hypothetical protein